MPTKRQQQARRATLRPHPVRDQIVDLMRTYGLPISPMQVATITDRTLGSVAYHVRTLLAAGIVELADEGRVRGAVQHFYALTDQEGHAPIYDPTVTLVGLCGALSIPDPDGGYPQPVTLDDRARGDLRKIIERLQPEVRAIASASTERAG